MSGKLRAQGKERESERAERQRRETIYTRGVYDGVSVRRGEATLPEFSPPSRTPLLHATTIRRHEGEEGGGHKNDHDDEYTAIAVVC